MWIADNDGKPIRDFGGFGGTVFKMRYANDGKSLVACSGDKTIGVFSPTGSAVRKLQGHKDWVYSIAISRDGKTIASGSWDGEVKLWNAADGKEIRSFIVRLDTRRRRRVNGAEDRVRVRQRSSQIGCTSGGIAVDWPLGPSGTRDRSIARQ